MSKDEMTDKKPVTKLDNNDWGFSLLNAEEISDVRVAEEAVLEAIKASSDAVIEANNAANRNLKELYQMIMPLLVSLETNPEKDYIHWPGRAAKVLEFKDKIYDFVQRSISSRAPH